MELKDRKIRVNSMSPGPIDTPALEKTTGLTAERSSKRAAQWVSQIPLGRRGKPEEIAAAVVFLASDESSYITGVDLCVDGGMAQVQYGEWRSRGGICSGRSEQARCPASAKGASG
jgi:NAD(P)-dependent dehydrogenase (short-subunit alcohol dehydrogenase family)